MDGNMRLMRISTELDEMAEEGPGFIAQAMDATFEEEAGVAPYYEIRIHTVADATRLKLTLNRINNDYIMLNKMNLTAAKRTELESDLKKFAEYLENIERHPETFKPSENPFVPTHKPEFYALAKLDPELK